MKSLATASSNGSPSPRTKKSFSSKLSSFLSNKSSHIHAYSIDLDEPLKQYGPGETVKGTIILNVGKPLGVTHVVASLYGYVQVFRNHSKSSEVPRNNQNGGRVVTGQGKRWVSEYYGDGFASLFEEEIVLCGEGRLDPKLYHFRFEIEFPADLALPSSIDFERGTITYIVSSTITRPSTMAAQMSCERKVFYRENIDVGRLPTPKPHLVELRPLGQSSKPRGGQKRLTSYEKARSSRASTISKTNVSSRDLGSRDDVASPVQPPLSRPSTRSSSSSRNMDESLRSELRSSRNSQSPSDNPQKSISVLVQPSKSGCLPGETLSLVISIAHTKAVQSLHGVIVTLYRQARVDMHPSLPVVSNNKGQDGRMEDYYPRSKTGLGGLSLTAAGSSQSWRKDLSQTFAPLYIDPHTMNAEIKTAVQIPVDAFSSIRNVPGEMISFKYFVEVIIDIHGKLAGAPYFTALNTTAVQQQQSGYLGTPKSQAIEGADYIAAAYETSFIDTTQIRRERNAVLVQCDLTIGTKDSEKSRGKQNSTYRSAQTTSDALHGPASGSVEDLATSAESNDHTHPDDGVHPYAYDEHEGYYTGGDHPFYDNGYGYDWNEGYDHPHYSPYPQEGMHAYHEQLHGQNGAMRSYPYIPPPDMSDEANLSEKERLRRAEARLLPSEPPGAEGIMPSSTDDAPTAPVLPDEAEHNMPGPSSSSRIHYTGTPEASHHLETLEPTDDGGDSLAARQDDGHPSYRAAFRGAQQAGGWPEEEEYSRQHLERPRLQVRGSTPTSYLSVNEQESALAPADFPVAGLPSPAIQEAEAIMFGREERDDAMHTAEESLPRYER